MGRLSVLVVFIAIFTALVRAEDVGFNLSQHRALAESVRQLRLKTGWIISLEEPVWPKAAQRNSESRTNIHNSISQPPNPETLHVSLRNLSEPNARSVVIQQLVDTYNQQNPQMSMQIRKMGDVAVLLPYAVAREAKPQLILSTIVSVPIERRTPTDHMIALAKAISEQIKVPIDIDTAGFGFRLDGAYTGDSDNIFTEWGVTSTEARVALADFLEQSATPTYWQVDCQVGVQPSPGFCFLSLGVLSVEVNDRNGNKTIRNLYRERRSKTDLPPPPPPRPVK